jgi:cell division septation protein DedD
LSPDRDDDLRDTIVDGPRSIFSAFWFRIVLVILALGVVAAIGLPYLLDVIAPSAPRTTRKPVQARAVAAPEQTPVVAVAAAPAVAASESLPAPTTRVTPTAPPAPAAAKPAPATPPTRVAAPATPAAPVPSSRPPATTSGSVAVVGRVAEAPKRVAAAPKAGATAETASASSLATPAAKAPALAAKDAAGGYWVQVGAFRDPNTAKRVAASLRGKKFRVDESVKLAAAPAPAPTALSEGDRYSVVVSGRPPEDIKNALSAKSLRAEPASAGWTIVPAMPLAEAVALSRDLAVDGLTVQVRRAGTASRPAADPNAEPLHRVRVGPYPDRPAAVAVVRQLETAGYKPFIARGSE